MSNREESDETGRPPEEQIAELLQQVGGRRISRREVLRRGVALGLTVPAIGWLLAACGGDDDDDEAPTATTATGAATPTAGPPRAAAA